MDRLRDLAAIAMSSSDRADRSRPRCCAQLHHRGGASRRAGRGFAVVASEVKGASRCRPRVPPRKYEKNRALQRTPRFGRCGCTGFHRRSRLSDRYSKTSNGAVAEQNKPPARYPITPPPLRTSFRFGSRQRCRNRPARPKEAEAHGESVPGPQAVTCSAEAQKPRRGAAAPGRARRPGEKRTAACHLNH